jgi:hypothetical protein
LANDAPLEYAAAPARCRLHYECLWRASGSTIGTVARHWTMLTLCAALILNVSFFDGRTTHTPAPPTEEDKAAVQRDAFDLLKKKMDSGYFQTGGPSFTDVVTGSFTGKGKEQRAVLFTLLTSTTISITGVAILEKGAVVALIGRDERVMKDTGLVRVKNADGKGTDALGIISDTRCSPSETKCKVLNDSWLSFVQLTGEKKMKSLELIRTGALGCPKDVRSASELLLTPELPAKIESVNFTGNCGEEKWTEESRAPAAREASYSVGLTQTRLL